MSTLTSLRRWLAPRHRQLALWIALPVLCWSLTGLLHPLMSRWQPSAVAMQPPADMLAPPPGLTWSALPPPASVLPAMLPLSELRALTWQGHPYWLLRTPEGGLRYVDARDGRPADIGAAVVEALARHYTGEMKAAVSLAEVTAFSDEYPFINRYLPVWRVAFDRPDGLVAFIEPRSLALAALSDNWKTRFSWLFGNLHSWKWWHHEPSRDVVMSVLLALAAVMVLTGLVRALSGGSGRRPAGRRWHRRLGLLVSLAVLAWTSSGIFHLLAIDKSRPAFETHPLKLAFTAGDLRQPAPADIPPDARLQILAAPQGPLWHWFMLHKPGHHGGQGQGASEHAGHDAMAMASSAPMLHEAYVSARDGGVVAAEDYARALAAGVAAGARWLGCEPVTRFTPEYGFVQKRLPVYRLQFDTPDHLAVYVDPADAAVADAIRDLDRAEGFSFAYLHKVHWLDFLGKDGRDLVAGVFASLVLVLTLVGLLIWRRRR